jgi:hypothetical protein
VAFIALIATVFFGIQQHNESSNKDLDRTEGSMSPPSKLPTSSSAKSPPSGSSPSSPVGREFEVVLERHTGVDLDSGQKTRRFPSTGADLGIGSSETFDFEAAQDSTVYLMATAPSLVDCQEAAASSSSERIDSVGLEDLPVGTYMCVTTDRGQTASIVITQVRNEPYDRAMVRLRATAWG